MTSKLSGRTASKTRMGIGAGSLTTWCYATLTAGFQKEVSPGSFARIAAVNSYFASPVKPGVFVPHATCPAEALAKADAKRAAAFAAFLQQELLEDVGHAIWSFSIPKMLRPYFLFHRELLTELARAGYETVHELMAAAVDDKNVRLGMVASIQTFSDNLAWNPLCGAPHNGFNVKHCVM